MNKHNIILAILFLVLGFGAGYFYFKNFSNTNNVVENQEVKNDTVALAQNKLFEFLDSRKNVFVEPGYVGEISFPVINLSLSLMIVDYPIHQEGTDYAVYDYKNNLFYDKVGNSGLDEVPNMPNAKPEAFINQDQVLMRSGINSDEPNSSEYPLSVKNFRTGEIVKVLPIKFDLKSRHYNKVRFSQLQDGKVYISVSQVLSGNKILSDVTYILDATTLEVKKAS